MAKLPRVTAKVFASNAAEDDLGQFGSALTGAKITNNDISVLQALPAFEVGWRDAVISSRNYPTLQEMNSVQRIASQQIAYTLQNGMPEWDEGTTYYTNQFCRVGTDFYYSLLDDNIGNQPEISPNEWKLWSGGGGGGASRNVGETVFSLLPLTDAGLHQLDGSVLEGAGAYKAFVAYIASLYKGSDIPPAYFVTEEEWQQSVSAYGACGKFVYNSDANTVRLPKVTGILEGTLDANALGQLVEAGLPSLNLAIQSAGAHTHARGTMEITGSFGPIGINDSIATGAFSKGSQGGILANTGEPDLNINFNASRSWTGSTSSNGSHTHTITIGSSLIGKTDTVQPQTIKGFLYIVIANAVKTEIEVDIDNVMSDVNNKADNDLANVNTINPGSAVQTALNNKVDKNSDVIDGQWVYLNYELFAGTTFEEAETKTFSLDDVLPKDNYVYECLFNCYIRTGSTSGNAAGGVIFSGSSSSTSSSLYAYLCRCTTRTNSTVNAAGCGTIPIFPNDRNVTYSNQDSVGTSGNCGVRLQAYRRLGTNQ